MAKTRTPPIYTTPQDAALAFYQAFEAKDIDAMMGAWADDEEIVCVHPGGTRLVGYDAVRVGLGAAVRRRLEPDAFACRRSSSSNRWAWRCRAPSSRYR